MRRPGGVAAWARLHRDTRGVVLGFVDQAFSTATNFGLTVLAGRVLGAAGLGEAFIGFSVYLVAMGVQRRLVTDPLVASTAVADDDVRRRTAIHTLTFSLTAAVLVALGATAVGLALPGFAGRGILLFTPWLVPALVQDAMRNVLFRDHRGAAAAVNDGSWLAVMAVLAVPAWAIGTSWAVVGCWGAGALAAMILGFFQLGMRPRDPRGAWRWWRRDALPFGKWNAGAAFMANIAGTASTFILAAILGAESVGGLRAAQSVFAPLTLVIPAISMPGLPAVSRALREGGFRPARRKALRLSAIAVCVTALYVLTMALGGWRLLPFLFGPRFARYRFLIPPIAVAQLFTAAGVGLLLILKAGQRGRMLLVNRAIGAGSSVVAVGLLAWADGLRGAAWGVAVGAAASLGVLAFGALRQKTAGPASPLYVEESERPVSESQS
jgi:O-antigen/teichoic acid export membrane protein